MVSSAHLDIPICIAGASARHSRVGGNPAFTAIAGWQPPQTCVCLTTRHVLRKVLVHPSALTVRDKRLRLSYCVFITMTPRRAVSHGYVMESAIRVVSGHVCWEIDYSCVVGTGIRCHAACKTSGAVRQAGGMLQWHMTSEDAGAGVVEAPAQPVCSWGRSTGARCLPGDIREPRGFAIGVTVR